MHRRNDNHTHHYRLKGHDYSEPGYYFVTFNTLDRIPALGHLEGGNLVASPIGAFVWQEIVSTPGRFNHCEVDCFAVMPDHVHLLIYISLESEGVAVSDIVRSVKGRSSAEFRRLDPSSGGRLWQKSYMDQIVRNDKHLDQVRRYINENPIRPPKDVWW